MKKITLLLLLCYLTTSFVTAQTTAIPDANFEAFLEANGMGDGIANNQLVTTANINTVTGLDVSSQNIADLTGIEDFVALEVLYCFGNQLTNLNISQNTALTELYCYNNQLTNLNVILNTALTTLSCGNNSIPILIVSQNTALTTLNCKNNQLATLNVTQNTALTLLNCSSNNLTSLDVTQNTALTGLLCQNNALLTLNVKNGNNTSILNANFNATNNPNLLCIEVDNETWSTTNWTNIDAVASFAGVCNIPQTYVPDNNFEQALIDLGYDSVLDNYVLTSNINTVTSLDVSAQSILDLTGIEDFVTLTSLTCHSNNLTSLDVTQNTALTYLSCSFNQLTSLDVTQNTALNTLYCYDNVLTSLDVTQNTALVFFGCSNNPLTSLDISQNTALTYLSCSYNQLTSLDVTQKLSLTTLYCFGNQLTSLDLTQNTALTKLNCSTNSLTSLNVKNGNNLAISDANFDATGNPNLTCIEVDDATYSSANWSLRDLQTNFNIDCNIPQTYVPDNNFEQALINLGYDTVLDNFVLTANINTITSLDVSALSIADLTGIKDFIALTNLQCFNNSLATLDITQNTVLTTLNLRNNQLTSLDVTQNTALTLLNCRDNLLTSLDVSQNTALTDLISNNNQLTGLDLTQNTTLTKLLCQNNALKVVNVKNGNNTNITSVNFDTTNNPNLICIEVDNATYSTSNWANIDATSSFGNNCLIYTYVPDDNFEQALAIYDGPVLDNYVLTANINTVTNLDVTFQNITDLTGIEGFTALVNLNCGDNNLTSLDVSQNTVLTELRCFRNNLTSLTVNTALTYLSASLNNLTSLDVSQNIGLTTLYCAYNQLTSLNIKNGNNINIANIDFNATNNPNLTCVNVDNAAWSTANWTNVDATSSFSENCNLGINDIEQNISLTIFPNPATNIVTIKTPQLIEITKAELFDVSGKKLQTLKSGNNTFNISNLNAGLYFISIMVNQNTVVKKLIVN